MAYRFEQFSDKRKSILRATRGVSNFINTLTSTTNGFASVIRIGQAPVPNSQIESAKKKIDTITDMLNRNHMKISIFGRNSSGKSTVANALLECELLPSGIGHITNCFVHLQGTDLPEGYVETEKYPGVKTSVSCLDEIASALEDETTTNSVLKVHWPKSKCKLLAHDLVLIDSPGSEIDDSLDEGIKNNCQDSDVFILVVNGECALTKSETNFFRSIKNEISKADVFIVINRWDRIDTDSNAEKVERQHLEKSSAFLCDETNVQSEEEAKNRIFFVSARERLNKPKDYGDNQTQREKEFSRFLETLQSCAVSSTFRSKCIPHIESALDVCKCLYLNLDENSKCVKEARERLEIQKEEEKRKNDSRKHKITTKISAVENEINKTISDFEQKIFDAIIRVRDSVDTFVSGFSCQDYTDLEGYKKALSENLQLRIQNQVRIDCQTHILTRKIELQNLLHAILIKYVSNEHRQGHNAGLTNMNWDFNWSQHLNNLTTDDGRVVISQAMQQGWWGILLNPVVGVGAMLGGFAIERKIVSDFKEKYIDHAENILMKKLADFRRGLSSQIQNFLANELKSVKEKCEEEFERRKRNQETESQTKFRPLEDAECKLESLRRELRIREGQLSLLQRHKT